MCCNFRGCIGFVIGVIVALALSALAAFGEFSGAFSIVIAANSIIGIAGLLILIASLFAVKTGCCRSAEETLCALLSCILYVIITGLIAIILTIVVTSLTAVSMVVSAIIVFFIVLAFIVQIISFISLFVYRLSSCDDDDDDNNECFVVGRR